MKNIGAEKQLSEYNHVYKENTAIYRDLDCYKASRHEKQPPS